MNLFLFTLNNFCLLFFATVISYNTKDRGFSIKLLKIATIYIMEILGVILVSGLLLQKLNLATLTLFSITFFIISIPLVKRKGIHFKIKINKFKFSLSYIRGNQYLILILAAVGFTVLCKLFYSIILIPYCYDSLAYHLTGLVDYIQNQKIFISDKLVWSNCYPRNIEMLDLWSLIYFRNGIALNVVQYLLTLMGALAVYEILKGENVKRKLALLGAALYLATPIMLAQMSSTYIDTSMASVFICCIFFMIKYFKEKTYGNLCYAAVLLGFVLGSKYSSIGYYGITIFVFVIIYLFKMLEMKGIGVVEALKSIKEKPSNIVTLIKEWIITTIKPLAVLVMLSLLVGGVWYILNLINFGNPLHPFKVGFLGHTIFDGQDVNGAIMDANTPAILLGKNKIFQVLYSWIGIKTYSIVGLNIFQKLESALATIYDQAIGGFGFQWIILFVPSTIILLYKRIRNLKITITDLIIFITLGLSFIITPSNWWSRYTCFVVLVGIYSFIVLLNHGVKHRKWFKHLVLMILTVFVFISCWQGAIIDNDISNYVMTIHKANPSKPLRSTSVQISPGNLNDMLVMLNEGNKGYDVLCFDVNVYMFFYQGDRTQNRVKSFYYGDDNKLKNYNINTYERFYKVLKENPADYVIVNGANLNFKDFMSKYAKEEKEYVFAVGKEGDSVMYKRK